MQDSLIRTLLTINIELYNNQTKDARSKLKTSIKPRDNLERRKNKGKKNEHRIDKNKIV